MAGFSNQEYERRVKAISEEVVKKGADGALILNPFNVFYMGLYYHPGKRPVILYVHKDKTVIAVTPSMEAHEAQKIKHFNKVTAYEDNYAKGKDLFDNLKASIESSFKHVNHVLVDAIDLGGYQRLDEMFNRVELYDSVLPHRIIKSPEEISMLKKAAYYSDFIVGAGKAMLKPGISEIGTLHRMISQTVDQMVDDMGEVIDVPGGPAGALVPSGIRTALPHALPSARRLEANEPMLLSCGANVWGYRVECERTFFVGEPTKAWIKAFNVMKTAQQMGIDLMVPGAICEDIDKTVSDYIRGAGYGAYIRHRTGHGKGLEEHETPYIALGDQTIIQPGMIFSSEPGIYIEGFSGFRHSDIIWVSEHGPQVLTQYPKDLESMIVKI